LLLLFNEAGSNEGNYNGHTQKNVPETDCAFAPSNYNGDGTGKSVTDEDIELVESAKNGDHRDFERLVTKYKSMVFNVVHSFTGNYQESEDISQEVFVKAYFALDSFQYKSSFSTWLYRVTVNQCLDTIKKKKRRNLSLESDLNTNDATALKNIANDRRDNVEDAATNNELQGFIQKALDSLPGEYRIATILKEIENLSCKEIARIMNASVGKVKTLLFRARGMLRTKLTPFYESGGE
jgi:RNA polymerase sigma-70 factor, ECF subfamily